jgi:hypothetical protein
MKTISPRESPKDLIKKINENFAELVSAVVAASQIKELSADQLAAITGSASPSAANVFATTDDLPASPIQIGSLTLLSASWAFISGLYEYDLTHASILATSIVDVIPDNADIDTVIAAQFLPKTVSSEGSVKLYAKNAPTGNIGVTINIY